MAEDSGVNIPDGWPEPRLAQALVRRTQTKLHQWAAADTGRRFDDLYNLVYDPATLVMAWQRVAGNTGARTAGVDGSTVYDIRHRVGEYAFLQRIREQLKARQFQPVPVRQLVIPKPGKPGKMRKLGIPTVADRVVQAALLLVLEPIFEADFKPCSYGFRPYRRAQDAIAEIHMLGAKGYQWVLDADIEACFDSIDHTALMDRLRARIGDKRVLTLVKGFLKAGIMTETGVEDSSTGTAQGGILSPLLANIALSVLDEHFDQQWRSWSVEHRKTRRKHGLGTWRIVRYADDFVVLVHGQRPNAETVQDQVTQVLAPMGLRLSQAKTRIVHMSDGFDFLGFHIKWMRKRGTDKWFVYTFIAAQPVRQLKAKIRALTRRLSHADYKTTLIRINQILRGWANYFQHAVAKHTFDKLAAFAWWRVISWVMHRHRMRWRAVQRWLRRPDGWQPIVLDGVKLFDISSVKVTRYRMRGSRIPTAWPRQTSTQRHDLVESPVR